MLNVVFMVSRLSDALGTLARPPVKTIPISPRAPRWAPRQEGLAAADEDGNGGGDLQPTPTSLSGVLGAELLLLLLLTWLSIVVVASGAERLPHGLVPSTSGVDKSQLAYATAVGTVSLGMSLGLLLLRAYRQGDWLRLDLVASASLRRAVGRVTVLEAAAFLLVVWWVPAAFALTFMKPFEQLGNGFFALWGGLLASVRLLTVASHKYQDAAASFARSLRLDDGLTGLTGAALLLLVASGVHLSNAQRGAPGAGRVAWALLASLCTLVMVVMLRVLDGGGGGSGAGGQRGSVGGGGGSGGGDGSMQRSGGVGRAVATMVLLIMWATLAPLLTHVSDDDVAPFALPRNANAYFASWAGLGCAVSVAMDHFSITGARLPPRAGPAVPEAPPAPMACPLCGGRVQPEDKLVSVCSVCHGRCHDRCVTKVDEATASKGQLDWVCPACKLVSEAVASAIAEQGDGATPAQIHARVLADGSASGLAGAVALSGSVHPALLE